MKVLLIGNYTPDCQYSMLGFNRMLEAELNRVGHEVRTMRPEVRLGRLGRAGTERAKWLGYVDKFLLFPARLREAVRWADVAHICDHGYSPYTRHLQAAPHVVTCHDLISVRGARGEFSEVRTRWSGRVYQQMILNGLVRTRHVVCDSEATRRDLLRLSGVSPSATSVVHIALNFAYQPGNGAERAERLSRLGIGMDEQFILHVGPGVWYKNQAGVVRIFEKVAAQPEGRNLELVMVSKHVDPVAAGHIRKFGLESRVRILSEVEPEDLQALYSSAEALLFPSLYEGFGWPIIEAQACGCPVFASNRSPMTEVGGEGAVYFDPENHSEAGNTIIRNLPRASWMREAGFVNVRRFSAEKMVQGYVNAYAEAIKSAAVRDDELPPRKIRIGR